MEVLAGFFVGIVTLFNTALPDANIARTLGVSVQNTAVLSSDDEVTIRNKIRENTQQRIKEAREKAISRRTEFKERAKEIKDTRKRTAIEKLDTSMAQRNQKWVEHWNKVLDRLSEVVQKLKVRGVNTSEAETAIAKAREQLAIQSAKEYVITITSEAKLREDVAPVIAQFKNDITVTQNTVKQAREAAVKALQALKVSQGELNEQ